MRSPDVEPSTTRSDDAPGSPRGRIWWGVSAAFALLMLLLALTTWQRDRYTPTGAPAVPGAQPPANEGTSTTP